MGERSSSCDLPLMVLATVATSPGAALLRVAREAALSNPRSTVHVPGCWLEKADTATAVGSSSVRTLGLGAEDACHPEWRAAHLLSRWTRTHQPEQADLAASDVLTAIAARRVLPAACSSGLAGSSDAFGGNATRSLSRGVLQKMRKVISRSTGGPGCTLFVFSGRTLLMQPSGVEESCAYYGATAVDAVINAPLYRPPARSSPTRLDETCAWSARREVGFLSLKALSALSILALAHAPRFRLHYRATVCPRPHTVCTPTPCTFSSVHRGPHAPCGAQVCLTPSLAALAAQVCPLGELTPSVLPSMGVSSLWLGADPAHGPLPHRAPSTRCTADLVRHVLVAVCGTGSETRVAR